MRAAYLVFLALVWLTSWGAPAEAAKKGDLSIFYIGNVSTPRGKSYVEFLSQSFRRVEAAERKAFDPHKAADFDVVLLDWSQGERQEKPALGNKDAWNKPTVLLGSNGLLLAEAWQIHGAIG
jgi:hypothetical protein